MGNRIITGYGALVALGCGLGFLEWLYLLGHRFQHAVPSMLALLGLVLAAFSGSRLLFVLEREMALWLGQTAICTRGHMFCGALLGGLATLTFLYRADPTELYLLMDCAAPAIGLGYAIGKVGCLSYGCCVGRPTRSRLAVRYTSDTSKAVGYYGLKGVPLAPIQIYEAILGLALLTLLSGEADSRFGSGHILGRFLLLFGAGRVLLFWFRHRRPDERAGLFLSGTLNVILAVLGVLLLGKAGPRLPDPVAPAGALTEALSLSSLLLLPAAVALLVLLLVGVTRSQSDPSGLAGLAPD